MIDRVYRIRSYHGGLGDELQFSTFPELFTACGYEVHLLKDSNEVLPFRNFGIKQFVWGRNPYIKAESSGDWRLGDKPGLVYKNTENDFIKNWEKMFGLEPQNSLPKIYYSPKLIKGVEGLIDTSALSLKYNSERVIEIVQFLVRTSGMNFKQIVSDHQANNIDIPGMEKIRFRGLYEAYDALCSCNEFISLSSGLHSVAAAARRQNQNMVHHCILPDSDYAWTMETKKFVYPGIKYIKE